jgi:hypothetical protein
VRWTYRVHEQILPSLRRAKIPVSGSGMKSWSNARATPRQWRT